MRILIRIISALEIVGGVFGIGFVIWVMLKMPFNVFSGALGVISIGIYALSLVAGIALWGGRPFGRKASIIVQTIQVPKLVSPLFTFIFSFGFDLWVHYLLAGNFATLGFEFRFLAFNQLFINLPGAPLGLGVSISAFFFLTVLFRYQPEKTVNETAPPPPPPEDWGHAHVPPVEHSTQSPPL